MAVDKRAWLIGLFGLAGLVLVWIFPMPSPMPSTISIGNRYRPSERPQPLVVASRLSRQAVLLESRADAIRLRDSLANVVESGGSVATVSSIARSTSWNHTMTERIKPGFTAWRSSIEGESQIGLIVPYRMRWENRFFFGETSTERWCVAESRFPFVRSGADFRFDATAVEFCRLIALYGLPGTHVERWLRNQGLQMLESPLSPQQLSTHQLGILGRGLEGWAMDRINHPEPTPLDQCRSGIRVACTELIEGGTWVNNVSRSSDPGYQGVIEVPQGGYLTYFDRLVPDLIDEMGEEAFGRFWSSDLPFEEAFQTAFGVEIEDWVHEWLMQYYHPRPAGPKLAVLSILGSLAWIVAFGGLAAFTTKWRSVEGNYPTITLS